jgi:hypothetical protein
MARKIGVVRLYEKYFERKLHRYLTEKQRVDITNDSVLGSHERLKERFWEDFEKCALVAILPSPVLKSLHNKQTEKEILPFLFNVQAGKKKTGVVMKVVDGKPQVLHPTLVEFFTARWFSRNFEFNRSVMEHILFDPVYRFVRDMFDRMLAKDCPLHCAVVERDEDRFENFLEGCDVSAMDKGGRTVIAHYCDT